MGIVLNSSGDGDSDPLTVPEAVDEPVGGKLRVSGIRRWVREMRLGRARFAPDGQDHIAYSNNAHGVPSVATTARTENRTTIKRRK
ncbi:hypothetical protein EHYA_06280 [Embleya hyalina]|uniref:Uncharacterized protein n=1 Tax=Embleya hyalina TaxID=516124 RepID=A0A401YVG4_9ACTN|nr:hypothetical protein EHYA_06280 [Embleya hyalina]